MRKCCTIEIEGQEYDFSTGVSETLSLIKRETGFSASDLKIIDEWDM